jgi:hypothetical protein
MQCSDALKDNSGNPLEMHGLHCGTQAKAIAEVRHTEKREQTH